MKKNLLIIIELFIIFLLIKLVNVQQGEIEEYEYRLRQSELINLIIEEHKNNEINNITKNDNKPPIQDKQHTKPK